MNSNLYCKIVYAILSLTMSFTMYAQGQLTVEGESNYKHIVVTPEKNTGLDAIYVLYSVNGVVLSYDSGSQSKAIWYKYSNLGGGYAEEIAGISHDGTVSKLSNPEGDMGYIIEVDDYRYYFWIVDYSKHILSIEDVSVDSEQECDIATIEVFGSGEPIKYFTINGQQKVLEQDITVEYLTLQWNDANKIYDQTTVEYILDSFTKNVSIMPAPYCNTTFLVSGDKFLKKWGIIQSFESNTYYANSVQAHTEAIQLLNDNDKSNQINTGDSSALGGSAPADITFYAYTTDAIVHHEWQIANDEEFQDITHRINEQDMNYVFTEEGTVYLRYIGSNADGKCEYYSDAYTVVIGASEIKCPNAFSPGVTEGVNDEWKVGYRSIIEFECTIFNRWGVEMCHFTNPELGWDGRYKGKLVKPGVYYYVIKALGADGKQYKLSGDINIIKFNDVKGSNSGDNSIE